MKTPAYDLRVATRAEILSLVERHHGYRSLGNQMTYCFAVYENGVAVAAFSWQPPPPGSAKAVCPEAPGGVLSLSRMVAVPHEERKMRHISRPLRRQMRTLIDRTRWPVLVTYSDEGQGHTGHVYKCSGWTPTVRSKRPVYETEDGRRASSYANGQHGTRELKAAGYTWVRRWEHRVGKRGEADKWMAKHGWSRVLVPGKHWANGQQAYTYSRDGYEPQDLLALLDREGD